MSVSTTTDLMIVYINTSTNKSVGFTSDFDISNVENMQSLENIPVFINTIIVIFNFINDYGNILVKIFKGVADLTQLEGFVLKPKVGNLISCLLHNIKPTSTIGLKEFEGSLYPKGMFDLIQKILNGETFDKIPLKYFDAIFSNNCLVDSINGNDFSFIEEYIVSLNCNIEYILDERHITLDNLIDTLNIWLNDINFKYISSNKSDEKYKIQIKCENGKYYIIIVLL